MRAKTKNGSISGGGSEEKERVGLLNICCCEVDDEAGMGTT